MQRAARQAPVEFNPWQKQPVQAPAYVLMDVETGRVLAQKNMHARMFPASTTKTMTALVALEKGNLNQMIRVGHNPPQVGEASIFLMESEKFSLRDLVRAAMIRSANDSCVAIAEGVSGDVRTFVAEMNTMAKKIGARHTHFVNPHGLHHPNHYTTAYDLALIARRAMRHSFFNEVTATKEIGIHGNYKIGDRRLLRNLNKMLFWWPACDGVKTGYTKQAGRCLIASATRRDLSTGKPWRLLSVVMKAENTYVDSTNLLLHQGFEAYQPMVVARAGKKAAEIKVVGGAQPAAAVVQRDLRLPLQRSEINHVIPRTRLSKLQAPVTKWQAVGALEYWANGKKLGEVPLVAAGAVEKSFVARAVPQAATWVPTDPGPRWFLYAIVIAFFVTLLAFLLTLVKMVFNDRRKKSRRAAAQRPQHIRTGQPHASTQTPRESHAPDGA